MARDNNWAINRLLNLFDTYTQLAWWICSLLLHLVGASCNFRGPCRVRRHFDSGCWYVLPKPFRLACTRPTRLFMLTIHLSCISSSNMCSLIYVVIAKPVTLVLPSRGCFPLMSGLGTLFMSYNACAKHCTQPI